MRLSFSALALLLLAAPVMAAEFSVINLSCDGEVKNGVDQTEAVKKVGLIVNLAQHTVLGFSVPARINSVSDAMVEFSGSNSDSLGTSSVMGTIDRVTGAAQISTILSAKDGKIIETRGWDLVRKVTQRLF
jgi:hypothetical protein